MKQAYVRADKSIDRKLQGITRRSFVPRCLGALLLANCLAPWSRSSDQYHDQPSPPSVSKRLIYVVDDNVELTELYRFGLESAGYEVNTFTDRFEALEALLVARRHPALLITDYLGYPISADQLMHCCRIIQPSLKILMASGNALCCQESFHVKPDRYLAKPFETESLIEEAEFLIGRAQRRTPHPLMQDS